MPRAGCTGPAGLTSGSEPHDDNEHGAAAFVEKTTTPEYVPGVSPLTGFVLGETSSAGVQDTETHAYYETFTDYAESEDIVEEECVIMGGPPGLDARPVYTRGQLTSIFDALIEPLAIAIHGCTDGSIDVERLIEDSTSEVEKFSLGSLLRDICSKVVPLTAALDAKQLAIDQFKEAQQRR